MAKGDNSYYKTEYIDVLDKATATKVLELDLSRGAAEAAKVLAGWWNDGVLLRSADPKAPALTDAEVLAVAGRRGMGEFADLDGYDLVTRYVDAKTGRVAYPEPHVVRHAGHVTQAPGVAPYTSKGPEVGRVLALVNDMCKRVVYDCFASLKSEPLRHR